MPIAEVPENIEEVLDCIEMVMVEEVIALREARKKGMALSAADIAAGYLNPKYGSDQQLSAESHTFGLACMVAVTLHWLACQETQ